MLVDGRIVAVKKSKVVDKDKLEEFINEVGVLSQINHRNIVKLLGCCLETEVPILVYEHIPHGDLFKRLHDDSDDYTMTWDLITGEKPVSVMRPEEHRGLASHFIEAMKENRVVDIVDSRIKEDCKLEQVLAVAKLARRCLSLKGKKRPNMREVSIELERIRSSPEDLEVHVEEEEDEEENQWEST
ncbi:unnamed protein product [Thlaspi arvense]|uniref:Protein kinase domain-containing protein n=1 Tax=Thlaspi arvense TaxID=13288 RepID=A0AAU9SMK3_THLAR|nr:unnamed protein product [Thlaspi arvense]